MRRKLGHTEETLRCAEETLRHAAKHRRKKPVWLGSFPKKSGTCVRASGELGAWTRLGGQGLCLCWPHAVIG